MKFFLLRHPSYQNGNQEEEGRRSPLTEEEEAMEGNQDLENGIAYSASINTNDHISRDEKEEESLPQDLSMISNRNVDS